MDILTTIAKTIVSIFIAPFILFTGLFSNNVEMPIGADTQLFLGGTTYTLSGSGVSSSATSFTLTSLTLPQTGYKIQDSDVSSTFYLTLEPGNTSRQEFVSCTTVTQNASGTATLSGCSRGLSPISPYTASSTLQFAHSGGTKAIFSNSPQLYDQATFKGNDESITGVWTFNSNLPTSSLTATSSNQFATKALVDATANQGAATSTTAVAGIVELATQIETASSTAWGGSDPHVIQSQYATSTPSGSSDAGLYVVVSENNGKINDNWLSFTNDNNMTVNYVNYSFPSTDGTASSTLLLNDGNGNLSWNLLTSDVLNINNATTDVTSGIATTSISLITIPVNTLTSSSILEVGGLTFTNDDTGFDSDIVLGNGTATTSMAWSSNSGLDYGYKETKIYQHSGSNQTSFTKLNDSITGNTALFSESGGNVRELQITTMTFNPAQQLYIDFQCRPQSNGNECGWRGIYVKLFKKQ